MREKLTDQKFVKANEALNLGIRLDTETLNLCKDGQLIHSRWYYDDLTQQGKYIFLDVTDNLSGFLFERINFAEDLRLKDIFVLVKNNIDFLEPVIQNWCREIVEEGLTNIVPYTAEYNPANIEYLDFYRYISIEPDHEDKNSGMSYIEGNDEVGIHGIGFELQEDYNHHSAGTRINWGLGFIPNNEIADTPVKIGQTIKLYELIRSNDCKEYKAYNPRLIDILHELFYELSWYGPPKQRDDKKEELKGM
jgi:hypothetical protein